jgi:hypothetical protein
MIPMAYLDADIRRHIQINPSEKSGESTNKNHYIKSRNSVKSLKNIDIGPAVVLHIGENVKQEPMRAYDFLGRPKEM